MSRIDDLIAEHCPDGVEYVPLGELVRIRNGKDYKSLGIGNVPVYGSGGVMLHVDAHAHIGPSVLIPRKGSLGNIFYVEGPFWTVDTIFYTEIGSRINARYLYHFMLTLRLEEMNQAGGVPSMTQSVLNKIKVPLPPIFIQQEIVRVLDKFTQLEAELEAELEARRQQYQYYRDELLTFTKRGGGVRLLAISEICKRVVSGGTPRAGFNEYYEGGTIPWLRTQEVKFIDIYNTELYITEKALKETSAKWVEENSVIVAISGATAGRSAVNKIPLTTNQHCCCLEIDEDIADYRYVFHWVSRNYELIKSLGRGARSDLNVGIIKSIKMPIPSLDEQKRIAQRLDAFDALVNSISSGLPAEIKARRKQYEYYRDELLTFKEKA